MTNNGTRANTARRANALKSTGPKSDGGKARSAQNARRHGLSRLRLDAGAVLVLFRSILGEQKAQPPGTDADPRARSAWVLAEAALRKQAVTEVLSMIDGETATAEDQATRLQWLDQRRRILRYRNAAEREWRAALDAWQEAADGA